MWNMIRKYWLYIIKIRTLNMGKYWLKFKFRWENKVLVNITLGEKSETGIIYFLCIYLFIYLPIYLSVCLSFLPCLSVCVCLSIYLSIYLSTYLCMHLSMSLSVCLPIYLSICLSVALSLFFRLSPYPSICQSLHLFTNSSIYPNPSSHPFVHPSTHYPPIHPVIHLNIWLSSLSVYLSACLVALS